MAKRSFFFFFFFFPGNVREASDLVAKTLGGDDGDILGDALVGREVEGEAGVVLLDDDTRSLRFTEEMCAGEGEESRISTGMICILGFNEDGAFRFLPRTTPVLRI